MTRPTQTQAVARPGPIDHAATYRGFRLRHLPHRLRLRRIEALIRSLTLPERPVYADFGCSNGYVTERVRRLVEARHCYGFDHESRHFELGRRQHPSIDFHHLDLNSADFVPPSCDLVTCLETLEHVGRPDRAFATLLAALRPGGTLVISVPVEIGWRGLAKFTAKRALGYDLAELPQQPRLGWRYLRALLTGERISRFRDERDGWGTHFGFDYRDIDALCHASGVPTRHWTSATTRFYVLRHAR